MSTDMPAQAQASAPATLACHPDRQGDTLVFPYVVTNTTGAELYVADALPSVDPRTNAAVADRNAAVVLLQPDGYALVLRGIPPLPPMPVTVRVMPLWARIPSGGRLERRLTLALPLAEHGPYESQGLLRDYQPVDIKGVVLAVDVMPGGMPDLTALPVPGAPDLFQVQTRNTAGSARRVSCILPAKSLTLLRRTKPT